MDLEIPLYMIRDRFVQFYSYALASFYADARRHNGKRFIVCAYRRHESHLQRSMVVFRKGLTRARVAVRCRKGEGLNGCANVRPKRKGNAMQRPCFVNQTTVPVSGKACEAAR